MCTIHQGKEEPVPQSTAWLCENKNGKYVKLSSSSSSSCSNSDSSDFDGDEFMFSSCGEETKEETKQTKQTKQEKDETQELIARFGADSYSSDDSDTVVDLSYLRDHDSNTDDDFSASSEEDLDVLSSSDEDLGLDFMNLGDSSSSDSDIEPVRQRPEIVAASLETKSAKDLAVRKFAREQLELLELCKMEESILESQLKIFHSFMIATFGEGEVPALTQEINFPRTLYQLYKYAEIESMESVLLDVCPNGSVI